MKPKPMKNIAILLVFISLLTGCNTLKKQQTSKATDETKQETSITDSTNQIDIKITKIEGATHTGSKPGKYDGLPEASKIRNTKRECIGIKTIDSIAPDKYCKVFSLENGIKLSFSELRSGIMVSGDGSTILAQTSDCFECNDFDLLFYDKTGNLNNKINIENGVQSVMSDNGYYALIVNKDKSVKNLLYFDSNGNKIFESKIPAELNVQNLFIEQNGKYISFSSFENVENLKVSLVTYNDKGKLIQVMHDLDIISNISYIGNKVFVASYKKLYLIDVFNNISWTIDDNSDLFFYETISLIDENNLCFITALNEKAPYKWIFNLIDLKSGFIIRKQLDSFYNISNNNCIEIINNRSIKITTPNNDQFFIELSR